MVLLVSVHLSFLSLQGVVDLCWVHSPVGETVLRLSAIVTFWLSHKCFHCDRHLRTIEYAILGNSSDVNLAVNKSGINAFAQFQRWHYTAMWILFQMSCRTKFFSTKRDLVNWIHSLCCNWINFISHHVSKEKSKLICIRLNGYVDVSEVSKAYSN